MLLSIQQRYILETVQTLGYIQRRQLHILTQRKFQATGYRISEAAMNAMLRQLRACQQDIRLDDLGVWIAGFQPNPSTWRHWTLCWSFLEIFRQSSTWGHPPPYCCVLHWMSQRYGYLLSLSFL